MICPYCSAENIEGSDVCVNCGQPLYGLDLPGAPQGSQSPDFIHQPLSLLSKREAVTVGADDPVALAVRLMQTRESSCVLVMDGERIDGIITGWDILHKVAGPGEDLNAVSCAQIMTPDPITLQDDDSIALALNMMASGGFRHIPILSDNQPTGIIDVNDVFRQITPHLV